MTDIRVYVDRFYRDRWLLTGYYNVYKFTTASLCLTNKGPPIFISVYLLLIVVVYTGLCEKWKYIGEACIAVLDSDCGGLCDSANRMSDVKAKCS